MAKAKIEEVAKTFLMKNRQTHYCYFFEGCEEFFPDHCSHVVYKFKPGSSVITVAYQFFGNDLLFGATKWKAKSTKDSFTKKSHRKTASGRMMVRPVHLVDSGFEKMSRAQKKTALRTYISSCGYRGDERIDYVQISKQFELYKKAGDTNLVSCNQS